MTYDDLISHYTTQADAGAALKQIDGRGVAQSTVSGWRLTGIPAPRQAQYEIITKGKLKAERQFRREAA